MDYENWMEGASHLFRLEAMHIKTNDGNPDFVELYPYIESYSEVYDNRWNQEDVYGRMDGINNFQSTKRNISLGLRIVAADLDQAKENMLKISKMIRFLYPAITTDDSVNNIRSSPVLRLKFGNLIMDSFTKGGLFGFINGGFNINPIHQDGYFTPTRFVKTADGKIEKADPLRDKQSAPENVVILWKHFDINFTFSVLHNHPLGNGVSNVVDSNGIGIGDGANVMRYFPYDINSEDLDQIIPFPGNEDKQFSGYDEQNIEFENPWVILDNYIQNAKENRERNLSWERVEGKILKSFEKKIFNNKF